MQSVVSVCSKSKRATILDFYECQMVKCDRATSGIMVYKKNGTNSTALNRCPATANERGYYHNSTGRDARLMETIDRKNWESLLIYVRKQHALCKKEKLKTQFNWEESTDMIQWEIGLAINRILQKIYSLNGRRAFIESINGGKI